MSTLLLLFLYIQNLGAISIVPSPSLYRTRGSVGCEVCVFFDGGPRVALWDWPSGDWGGSKTPTRN